MVSRRAFLLTPAAIAAAADRKPNVVLMAAANWRAQAVPWASDSEIDLPNLAAFGRESLTFSRAYSSYPRLTPARTALLKGRFPVAAQAEAPSLSTVLKTAGFRVRTFGSRQAEDIVTFVHAVPPSGAAAPFYVEWLFDSPGSLLDRAGVERVRVRENVPEESWGRARTLLTEYYSRCIAQDRDIGMVLAALDRPGLIEETLVIFVSCHGDQLGSHGIFDNDTPFEESVRIPLALRYPRGTRQTGDRAMLVSQIDLMPTIAGLCGVDIPQDVQGRDLSRQILSGSGEIPDAVYAIGRSSQSGEWRMLVHGYDKLVTAGDGSVTHLYNLAEDPFENTNLADARSEQLKRDALVAQQRMWIRKLGDRVDPASGLRIR